MSSENLCQNWRENLRAEYYRSKMRLKNAGGLIGLKCLNQSQIELAKNREAESRSVRQKMWKSNEGNIQEDKDMGHVVLGDYQPQQHVHHHEQRGSMLAKLAMVGVAATGIGLPIGAALSLPSLLEKNPVVEKPEIPPTTSTIEDWKLGTPIVE